jgi:hypothetical protein
VKLSDLMSAADLAVYAEAALVLFMLVFVAVTLDLLFSKDRYKDARLLPLADETPARKSASEPQP